MMIKRKLTFLFAALIFVIASVCSVSCSEPKNGGNSTTQKNRTVKRNYKDTIRLNKNSDGVYMLRATIANNVPSNFKIDPSSNVVYIGAAEFAILLRGDTTINSRIKTSNVTLADGKIAECKTFYSDMTIGRKRIKNVQIFVMPSFDTDPSIGQNILDSLNPKIDYAKSLLIYDLRKNNKPRMNPKKKSNIKIHKRNN